MDEDHFMAVARYLELNPARARRVSRAQDWRWSSVRAHLEGRDDALVSVPPLLARCDGRFGDWIEQPLAADHLGAARRGDDRPTSRVGRFSGPDGDPDGA
jgi:putative transposase